MYGGKLKTGVVKKITNKISKPIKMATNFSGSE